MRLGLVLISALVLSACGGTGPSDQPSTTSPSSNSPSSSSPSVPAQSSAVALYWVGDTAKGLRLFREFKAAPKGVDPVITALETLFTSVPQDRDYSNLWTTQAKVNAVTREGDLAYVDITPGRLNVGSEAETRAIDQIVWTTTAADPSIKKVRILIEGKQAQSLAGHVDLTQEFVRGLTYEVLADIWILKPEEAQAISGSLTVEGVATTFEANVAWRLTQNGEVIRSGSTTAAEAAPARAPWSFTVEDLAPGEYVVHASEYSAKDGSLVTEDTKTFTIK